MNRSNYKVLVESKKQAKQFKQALLAVGEKISPIYWTEDLDVEDQNYLIYSGIDWFCTDVDEDIHEEVTFKELLALIVNDVEEVKPSLLDEKVIIEACDERQLKILMGHYESNGWKAQNGQSPNSIYLQQKDQLTTKKWKYGNDFHGVSFDYEMKGYKIIPFSAFAVEIGIKVPVFVMKSEDGVPLYDNDRYYGVSKVYDAEWTYSSDYPVSSNMNVVRGEAKRYKAFSTKQAAESWIAEANKPKEIIVRHNDSETSTITKDKVVITSFDKGHAYSSLHLHGKAIEEIYAALNALQN